MQTRTQFSYRNQILPKIATDKNPQKQTSQNRTHQTIRRYTEPGMSETRNEVGRVAPGPVQVNTKHPPLNFQLLQFALCRF